MNPQPPFVKNVAFTLMGLPQVHVSAIPMTERGINVLNLPLISGFVNNSIAAAANEYVAPKSMSLDVGKLLVGDDIKKGRASPFRPRLNLDTDAIGVLYVKIHRAVGLSAQDRNGASDTYITLAYSKYGKPMYSTRVIVHDLNPVWEESAWYIVPLVWTDI
jgi:Ca2+-dependent lipid-binding protein